MNLYIPYSGTEDLKINSIAALSKLAYLISDNIVIDCNFNDIVAWEQTFSKLTLEEQVNVMLNDEIYKEETTGGHSEDFDEVMAKSMAMLKKLQKIRKPQGYDNIFMSQIKQILIKTAKEYTVHILKRLKEYEVDSLLELMDDERWQILNYDTDTPEQPNHELDEKLSTILALDSELVQNEKPLVLLIDNDFPEFAVDKLPYKHKMLDFFNVNFLLADELNTFGVTLDQVNAPLRTKLSQWSKQTRHNPAKENSRLLQEEIIPLFKPMQDILLNSPIINPLLAYLTQNTGVLSVYATELSYEQLWEHCKATSYLPDETWEALHKAPYQNLAEQRIAVLLLHSTKAIDPITQELPRATKKSIDIG